MPTTGKKARGEKRMTQAGVAKRVDEAPSNAAEQANAGLGGASGSVPHANGPQSANQSDGAAGAQLPQSPKTVSQVLGEITWLMTQSPRHKTIALGDLEWLVMPAILLQQFRIFYKGEQPVGVAFWALADEIVAKRIDAGDMRLTPAEWKSGANKRIIDVVAPFGGEGEMIQALPT
ncbi:toxin-activating lysine-acyltransferase [Bradyrhizobium sp. PRIMUS42]|uniref:toxin-activating lysine-acyltransferase n=1 Tax=Bradyrhizobium sp. PRIMUS42 TaxID=2908926 RepID=UPI001FF3645A|nr:toxin-activating lysine-acyltransferase [Bradyrhizobium sp. PRIMUS42]MCJ9728973.1 toxin-activating lysine-acyltransferase [Bradyrhizobium sp. PRIMUS42]